MTSQLNVDTIVDKAGSGGSNVKMANTSTYVSDGGNVTQNTVQGLSKAWCRYNSITSTSFYDSFNCASLVDYGTAYTGINLTSAMSSANWSSVTAGGTASYRITLDTVGSSTKTTSLVRTYATNHDGAAYDIDDGNMTALGDLA